MNDDVIWCEDCKFFGHADMGGEGDCAVYGTPTWYGRDASKCPYFKRKEAEEGE
jgi:hypothetical protein